MLRHSFLARHSGEPLREKRLSPLARFINPRIIGIPYSGSHDSRELPRHRGFLIRLLEFRHHFQIAFLEYSYLFKGIPLPFQTCIFRRLRSIPSFEEE